MAHSQISCLSSLPLWRSVPRLPGRNVPLSDKAPTTGPPSTELLSKTTCKRPRDWRLEAGDGRASDTSSDCLRPPLLQPRAAHCSLPHHVSLTTSFFPAGHCKRECKICKTHGLCGQWWVQTGLISRKLCYESVCVCVCVCVCARSHQSCQGSPELTPGGTELQDTEWYISDVALM